MPASVLKKVRKLELKTKKLVEGLITGSYHSVFLGSGLEFSQIREYSEGDDVRLIDWKVTARFDKPYSKEFAEERDLKVYVVMDYSASSSFGSEKAKKEYMVELGATLLFSAYKNNDSFGLLVFTDKVESFIPARKGKKHLFNVLRELVRLEASSPRTNVEPALTFLSKVLKKRSVVFIISDLQGQDMKGLSLLRERHDVIGLRVVDPREEFLPDVGLVEVEDVETREQLLVDTSDPAVRERYEALALEEKKRVESLFNKYKADVVFFKTNQDFTTPLKAFFKKRRRRMR